jgi:hypothetical protein
MHGSKSLLETWKAYYFKKYTLIRIIHLFPSQKTRFVIGKLEEFGFVPENLDTPGVLSLGNGISID